jgi:hypothetical protein
MKTDWRPHTATVALVAWVLIAPPVSHGRWLRDAPLADWTTVGRYATRGECHDAWEDYLAKHPHGFNADELGQRNRDYTGPKCGETTDPRQQGNGIK